MGMSATIKKWAKDQIKYHTIDMSGVKPEIRCSSTSFYLNSCAGLVEFRSRDRLDMDKFRNGFMNRFQLLINNNSKNREYFSLYREILRSKWSKHARVKYKANLRTRMRLKIAG